MPKVKRKAVPMKDRKLRSGFERKIRANLEKAKVDYKYESMVIPYTVPESVHKYIPDFILANGVIVEAKGLLDRDGRKKLALVIEQNPDKDIRVLFQRNNRIAKNSKTTYEMWCKARNIKCAVSPQGLIPEEWLE